MVLRLAALSGPFLAALLSQGVLVPVAHAQQPAAKPPAASPKPTAKRLLRWRRTSRAAR